MGLLKMSHHIVLEEWHGIADCCDACHERVGSCCTFAQQQFDAHHTNVVIH